MEDPSPWIRLLPGCHQVWEPCNKMTLYKQQINQTHLTRAEDRDSLPGFCPMKQVQAHRLQGQEPLHGILLFPEDSEAEVSELRSLSLQTKGALLSGSCVH